VSSRIRDSTQLGEVGLSPHQCLPVETGTTSVLGTMSDLQRLGNRSLVFIGRETRRRSKLHSTAQGILLVGLLVFPGSGRNYHPGFWNLARCRCHGSELSPRTCSLVEATPCFGRQIGCKGLETWLQCPSGERYHGAHRCAESPKRRN
jgi:hypothetical protein